MRGPTDKLVVVRGAGDIATGVIQKLVHAGFRVLALEVEQPMAIRWRQSLATAVTRGRWSVEDVTGVRVASWAEAQQVWAAETDPDEGLYTVPILIDPQASVLDAARPVALVDAILAKRNVGTHRLMAPVTVGLGPGFSAGGDVDYVVETMRGHDLGRVITDGPAQKNTGVPGLIAGKAAERVIHSPMPGIVHVVRGIGDLVAGGDLICTVENDDGEADVLASIGGVIRGMIPDGQQVSAGFKIADIDPRIELVDSTETISDKSRAVGGAALDAVLQGMTRDRLW